MLNSSLLSDGVYTCHIYMSIFTNRRKNRRNDVMNKMIHLCIYILCLYIWNYVSEDDHECDNHQRLDRQGVVLVTKTVIISKEIPKKLSYKSEDYNI